jgi:hypothetical protein
MLLLLRLEGQRNGHSLQFQTLEARRLRMPQQLLN